ncbi:thiamine diphosphokinase [Pseudoflavonifractor sp. AF19-9AC]|nr:thiamine diphosphokinase [Pseudoflavonifractor sp. AF19-9AC]
MWNWSFSPWAPTTSGRTFQRTCGSRPFVFKFGKEVCAVANSSGICYVVGAMSLTPALRPYPAPGDYVIAADRGYDSLMAYGVTPDLVVGDFDSLGYTPSHPNLIQLPVEKDDTDVAFALRKGLDLGYRRFILLGGVGGRLEHTLGNLQILDWLTTQGAQGFLAGEKTVATALRNGTLTFPAAMSGYLSVFCNSGTAKGVSLKGLKFPLEDYTLLGSVPIGVSNQFLGQEATVSVEDGSLLLLWEEKGDFYSLLPRLWV